MEIDAALPGRPVINLLGQLERTARHLPVHHTRWTMDAMREVDSTSTEAQRRIEAGLSASPFIVAAENQTAGRGRGDRRWHSVAGKSLMFTAAIPVRELGTMDAAFGRRDANYPLTLWPLHIGLTLAVRLRQLGWIATLKWPNDVLLDGRKVAGVLCEIRRGWFLAGVGVNLLQTTEELGEITDARVPPTSLLMAPREEGEELSPLQAIPSLVQSVAAVLESPWPRERMLDYYRDWCATLGTRVEVTGTGLSGVASAVNEDGSLSVEVLGGQAVRISNEVNEVTG